MAIAERIIRKASRTAQDIFISINSFALLFLNRFSSKYAVNPEGPIVCLTTYGTRERDAYLTVESIARGRLRPSRIILWIDERASTRDYPATLKRLEKRGLEVRMTKDFGPHKKYYPYVQSEMTSNLPLITADDDTLYPISWLAKLWAAYLVDPTVVQCYRSRVITFDQEGKLTPYALWKLCTDSEPSYHHFATGGSGVLYPPILLEKLRLAGESFLEICPKADDIWLHAHALRAGFKVKQLSSRAIHFPTLQRTQSTSLQKDNLDKGRNDIQLKATYTEEDLNLLRASWNTD